MISFILSLFHFFQNPDRVEYLVAYAEVLAHLGHLTAAKQFLYRAQFVMFCKKCLQAYKWQLKISGPLIPSASSAASYSSPFGN
jgi:hypothetical protein